MKNLISSHKKLLAFILFFIIAAFIPAFIKSPYYLDLLIAAIVNTVLAISFIVLLKTGLVNLSLSAFWGIGAYTSAILSMKFGLSYWFCVPATVLITILFATIIGTFLIGRGSGGFGFVMLSSVVGMLFTVVVGNISYLGGYIGISNIPKPDPVVLPFFDLITFDSKVHFFYLALSIFAVVVLVVSAFYSAWIGRSWSAIGLNFRLAESIGIDLFKYKLSAFVVSSSLCGLIGSFYAHYQGFVMPDTYNMFTNIYIHSYAILGGIEFAVMGPLLGASVMTFFPELFRIYREFSAIFTGALLVFLIMFLPKGLLSLGNEFGKLREKFMK